MTKKTGKNFCSKIFLFLVFLSLNNCAFLTVAAGSFVGNLSAEIVEQKLKKDTECGK